MKYENIIQGKFISRPNRFIAHVEIQGKNEIAHVKNTGRCKEILIPGATIHLEDHSKNMGNRKTVFSLISAEKPGSTVATATRIINIDSQAPNKVVAEGLCSGNMTLPGLEAGLSLIKAESTFGDSRFDFYVESRDDKKAFIEVKGVTLENKDVVSFPDAPTERGVKHIHELIQAKDQGYVAYIIFIVQMENVEYFTPNDKTHPTFGEALRVAKKEGVEILAYDCKTTADSLKLGKEIKIIL
jgi:sugar fermentation stimulation protein A